MKNYHDLLKRQLRKCHISQEDIDEKLALFLDRVNASYEHMDNERYISARSLEISSKEMRALREDLEKTSKYIHSIVADAILILDYQLKVIEANEATGALLEVDVEKIKDKYFDDIFQLSVGSKTEQLNGHAILLNAHNNKKIQVKRGVLTLSKLKRKYVSFFFNKLPQESSRQQEAYILVISNITDRIEFERSLKDALSKAKHASKEKSSFLANMSHELRTPMNGVVGLLQILQTTPLSDEQQKYVDMSLTSANNMIRIINDTLDFSKLESGQMSLKPDCINIRDELLELEKFFLTSCQKKEISLGLLVSPSMPNKLIVDSTRFKQIIINLVNNAIKFTGQKGEIILRANFKSEPRPSLYISVSDSGIGINEKDLALIFESFKQAGNQSFGKFEGTGLGLAICKQLVELMGGEISVNSKEGVGTTFEFNVNVDVYSQSEALGSQGIEEIKYSPQKDYKVLVVEDNEINQIVVTEMLEHCNINAVVANNGKEALDIMAKQAFDLVFMDCQMPVMDGFETTRIIREREFEAKDKNHAPTKIIALTANAFDSDRDECINAGMNDHLAKPCQIEELKNIIQKHLKH